LMDQRWIYGGRPANLFDVIVEGRPGGMPAFGGKIPEDQIWKIIAYIATMGGMPAEDAIIAGEGGTSPQHGPSQLQNRAR
ncbi:MAG: c-type cytochrome, partial [Burkholderiales bacterium]|nr:c-type cytochrome [Burkholderiales bacterium]